jgi:hypothetical protein
VIGETASFTIIQGVDMGQPSELDVSVIAGEPGVRVSGSAHRIDDYAFDAALSRVRAQHRAYQLIWSGRPSS